MRTLSGRVGDRSGIRELFINQFAEAAAGRVGPEAISPQLRFAKLKVTNNCNSRCVTCDYWQHEYRNELTREEMLDVIRQMRALGVEELMITGGEPTMRPELPDLVAEAARLDFRAIGVTTNSLSLGPAKLDQVLASGLTEIVLSLEGLTSHDTIRGIPGNTKKVLDLLAHLRWVRRHGASRVAVKIAMTLMGVNVGEVLEMVDLARTYEATLFLNLIDRGTYFFKDTPLDLFAIPDRRQLSEVIDSLISITQREPGLVGNTISSLESARRYFDDPAQRAIPCHLGYIGLDVDANGDVYSNCWGLSTVGNIRAASLAEIITSEAYRRRCAAMFRKQCPGCSCGYILNLSYHKPSVVHDVSPGVNPTTSRIGYTGTKR